MKTGKILLLAATLLVVEAPLADVVAAPEANAPAESAIFKRKRKGYKPKRGGLFNTGLFRKKSACGCPKH